MSSELLGLTKEKQRRGRIREMSMEDAYKELGELRRHLFDLRMQKSRGDVKDTSQFSTTKKTIAALLHKVRMAEIYDEYEELADEDESIEKSSDVEEGEE